MDAWVYVSCPDVIFPSIIKIIWTTGFGVPICASPPLPQSLCPWRASKTSSCIGRRAGSAPPGECLRLYTIHFIPTDSSVWRHLPSLPPSLPYSLSSSFSLPPSFPSFSYKVWILILFVKHWGITQLYSVKCESCSPNAPAALPSGNHHQQCAGSSVALNFAHFHPHIRHTNIFLLKWNRALYIAPFLNNMPEIAARGHTPASLLPFKCCIIKQLIITWRSLSVRASSKRFALLTP